MDVRYPAVAPSLTVPLTPRLGGFREHLGRHPPVVRADVGRPAATAARPALQSYLPPITPPIGCPCAVAVRLFVIVCAGVRTCRTARVLGLRALCVGVWLCLVYGEDVRECVRESESENCHDG